MKQIQVWNNLIWFDLICYLWEEWHYGEELHSITLSIWMSVDALHLSTDWAEIHPQWNNTNKIMMNLVSVRSQSWDGWRKWSWFDLFLEVSRCSYVSWNWYETMAIPLFIDFSLFTIDILGVLLPMKSKESNWAEVRSWLTGNNFSWCLTLCSPTTREIQE